MDQIGYMSAIVNTSANKEQIVTHTRRPDENRNFWLLYYESMHLFFATGF